MPMPTDRKRKAAQITAGLLKSYEMTGVEMPQLYGKDITTGALAHWLSELEFKLQVALGYQIFESLPIKIDL
jgi:hypothetical protein